MKYKIFFAIFLSLFFVHVASATDGANAGFIPGQIWYSENPLTEGHKVKVYTAVWNGEVEPITAATVEFYDKDVLLGKRSITGTLSNGNFQVVSIDWKVTAGDHVISAKITSSNIVRTLDDNSKVNIAGGIARSTTDQDKQYVVNAGDTLNGDTVSSTVAIRNKINQTEANIKNGTPAWISGPLIATIDGVESLRNNVDISVLKSQKTANDKLKILNISKTSTGAEKPITYIKLFFLAIAAFFFDNPIVFYLALAVVVFLLLRFIFRKLRGL